MPLTTLTTEEAIDLAKAMLRALPGADVSDGSDYDIEARALAALFTGNQAQAIYLLRQAFPSLAEGEYLQLWADLFALSRLSATASVGRVMLIGADSLTQPAGSVLTSPDGLEYTLDTDFVTFTPTFTGKTCGTGSSRKRWIVLPDNSSMNEGDLVVLSGTNDVRAIKDLIGTYAIDLYEPVPIAPTPAQAIQFAIGVLTRVTASEAGAVGNKAAGTELTLAAPTGGITAATRVQELSGGSDIETMPELASRVVAHLQGQRGAGSFEDWRTWTRGTRAMRVAEAFIYAGWRGLGALDIVPFGVPSERQLGLSAIDLIADELITRAPALDDSRIVQWDYEPTPLAVAAALTPRLGYEPDWTGTFTVDTGSTLTRIELTASPVGTIQLGDRVLLSYLSGAQYVVVHAKTTGIGANYVDVETGLMDAAPAAGIIVYPGGPLVDEALAAIDAYFDSRGPGVGTDTNITRWPDPGAAWDPVVRPTQLLTAIQAGPGVQTATLSAPASEQVPGVAMRWRRGAVTLTHV